MLSKIIIKISQLDGCYCLTTDVPKEEAAKDIIHKIENLDDQYKIPFTRYYNGFKYEEIAQEMQLPLGTVKSRIFLARKQLMLAIENSTN